jgi:anthranilate synthase component 2
MDLDQVAIYDKILLSPGPGIPSEAGLLLPLIQRYAATKQILGVCLGHQAIAEAFGGKLENLTAVYHGVQTPIYTTQPHALFKGMATPFLAGRYHSWIVSKEAFPTCLAITAESEEKQIMALRHKEYAVCGIQFHPESILTPDGRLIIQNFLQQ